MNYLPYFHIDIKKGRNYDVNIEIDNHYQLKARESRAIFLCLLDVPVSVKDCFKGFFPC
jgi:hypothetical protein